MKKFINEYKVFRSKSETESSKGRSKVELPPDMGVFKWLRRERVTVTTHTVAPDTADDPHSRSATCVGTVRTDEYRRDLAEFQARRSSENHELPETPVKKKCGRHSLPVSCTDCATDHENTFNYEKKSAVKYKKKNHKRARSAASEERDKDGLPKIQFLFQNQVFMPGNILSAYSEPQKSKRSTRYKSSRSPEVEFAARKHIDFSVDQKDSPPLFYKNNSLPFNANSFLDGSKSGDEEVDGMKASRNVKVSSQSSERTRDDSCEEKLWEVMSELKHLDQWADEQLLAQNKSDDSKSDTSAYGLPIASSSDLDVSSDRCKTWNQGRWGVVPVQVKRLPGVSVQHVRRKTNTEINILRKCRHPNIVLLMGIYPDLHGDVNMICERCIDTLFGILHVQGRILSAQTSVSYALDIANALAFLRMQGYVHTALASASVMVTSHDAAKLVELGACVRLGRDAERADKGYEVYSPEPQYVNIAATRRDTPTPDSEPLISQHPSELYLAAHSVAKEYKSYRNSEQYRWQAPELFESDEGGMVRPCSKSDVYSLCLVLWECCNATVPWKNFTYDKLKESYTLWQTGLRLPQDGTYPGCLLALLRSGLKLSRAERIDLTALQNTLQDVKRNLDDIEYIIIPARLSRKKSGFSSTAWDTTPTDDSESQSPVAQNVQHKAVVHKVRDSSSESDKDCTKSDISPFYETIRNEKYTSFSVPEKCFISDEDIVDEQPILKYGHLLEKDCSSACSTPIAKLRARIKDIGTPGALHRSDSTEYCSIMSPDRRLFEFNNDSNKDESAERPVAKLSRSFTPKSYKPLHIKVPECNLDSVKSILKDPSGTERSSYNFDIKNYSLPTTPIARSNKLRKNAWLSGDLRATQRSSEILKDVSSTSKDECNKKAQSAPDTPVAVSTVTSAEEHTTPDRANKQLFSSRDDTPESVDTGRDSYTGLRKTDPPADFSETDESQRERVNSWTYRRSEVPTTKCKVEEDVLANVNVRPLVAIHERWIYEANRKTGRSMSLPGDNRSQTSAVKPASHCVDPLQKSLPQLSLKRPLAKPFRAPPVSPISGRNGPHWEQFCQARDNVARGLSFGSRESDRFLTWKRDSDTRTISDIDTRSETKIDQATDTRSIEEFIKDLIRKEFQHLLNEISDDVSSTGPRNEEIVNKGVNNIVDSLRNGENAESHNMKKDTLKSFSRVKINGNNKPLLQITFNRFGENSLQVLDNCVNVTICDNSSSGREKMSVSLEDPLTEDVQLHGLKRCQAFSAIQEARSTEDLYIDDDLSAQMQENFGGKVKLIPLHGSLHEILCEKEDDCCLIKVKQENGCDTIYFRCDNSDTESRDAIDGCLHDNGQQDTVVFKRSISLVEERFQRIIPKEKRAPTPIVCRRGKRDLDAKSRPKSEVFVQNISRESRILSNSSPSLLMPSKNDEVEVNIENVMSYQDSSSDECLKCQSENDDFELLEKKIEEDLAVGNISLTCGCLEKISEENLSVLDEDFGERD